MLSFSSLLTRSIKSPTWLSSLPIADCFWSASSLSFLFCSFSSLFCSFSSFLRFLASLLSSSLFHVSRSLSSLHFSPSSFLFARRDQIFHPYSKHTRPSSLWHRRFAWLSRELLGSKNCLQPVQASLISGLVRRALVQRRGVIGTRLVCWGIWRPKVMKAKKRVPITRFFLPLLRFDMRFVSSRKEILGFI